MRLICGYRRTGKDTLCQQINEGTISWLVYTKEGAGVPLGAFRPGPRRAFADRLKGEVQALLKAENIIFSYEDEKDSRHFTYQGRDMTYRQLCIEHGCRMREIDPCYWIRGINSDGEDVIVTDFRFPNEYSFPRETDPNIITIRVFRKEVPIPPVGEPSEHSLDNFLTDLLLVPSEADFTEALKLFPQYRAYQRAT